MKIKGIFLAAALLTGAEARTAVAAADAAPAGASPVAVAPRTAGTQAPRRVEMDPKVLIQDNNLGNCLACHAVLKHPELVAGNIGPPFVAMKQRFPDIARLKAIIYDEQANNPDTIMPPFGRNQILTAGQIDAIANYILQF
ncbi:MAG: sulfur oxidation c-type cytochrome SoxX [Burkholderiaceae bacterium]